MISDAQFSKDGTHRYSLSRIWDKSKPLIMFIGLNPSTANADTNDPTIESVIRISKHNGYGGFYMMNCWPYITSNPKLLLIMPMTTTINNEQLVIVSRLCQDVVFAWGNFKVVSKHGRDKELKEMFPRALTIGLNKNGSPKHPLFQKGTSTLIKFSK